VRFLISLGHFQRKCASPSHSRAERDDECSSWKSLFFYRCTDVILFAPLKSQGVDSRSDYIRKVTVTTAPPPCSPGGIYALANPVRRPSVGHLAHGTDASNLARNPTPLQQCPPGHQGESVLG